MCDFDPSIPEELVLKLHLKVLHHHLTRPPFHYPCKEVTPLTTKTPHGSRNNVLEVTMGSYVEAETIELIGS